MSASHPTKNDEKLILRPIGIIHTPYDDKYRAPRQPGAMNETTEAVISLFPHRNYEQALQDIQGFERIWILFWFHKNTTWKPKVLPPRSGKTKRGVFATRSPHRPNPIGLSLCRLIKVEGLNLTVENPDLLDGTPILDIKPYLPYAEAFPDSRSGWLETIKENEKQFKVVIGKLVKEQAKWLQEYYSISFLDRVVELLAGDPSPHPYRRIKHHPDGGYVIGVKSWRVRFTVTQTTVRLTCIESGYSPEVLKRGKHVLHDESAHREFQKRMERKN